MLTKLEIEGTRDTAYILFDKENNLFEIKGNSLPENTNKFFEPIFDWIEHYLQDPNTDTNLKCDLEYFNSSSAKMIYQIFIEFEKILEHGNDVSISWYFESGDALIEEKGMEYKTILNIPFNLIEK